MISESRDTPLDFCWHQYFFTANQQVLLYVFWYVISNSFNLFRVFKDCFNKHGYNFDDVIKIANLSLLKIKIIWNKGYDAIIFVHGVINKFLSRDSNYNAEMVIWPKFGNSSISTKEVIVTPILLGFDQKTHFFWGVVLL